MADQFKANPLHDVKGIDDLLAFDSPSTQIPEQH